MHFRIGSILILLVAALALSGCETAPQCGWLHEDGEDALSRVAFAPACDRRREAEHLLVELEADAGTWAILDAAAMGYAVDGHVDRDFGLVPETLQKDLAEAMERGNTRAWAAVAYGKGQGGAPALILAVARSAHRLGPLTSEERLPVLPGGRWFLREDGLAEGLATPPNASVPGSGADGEGAATDSADEDAPETGDTPNDAGDQLDGETVATAEEKDAAENADAPENMTEEIGGTENAETAEDDEETTVADAADEGNETDTTDSEDGEGETAVASEKTGDGGGGETGEMQVSAADGAETPNDSAENESDADTTAALAAPAGRPLPNLAPEGDLFAGPELDPNQEWVAAESVPVQSGAGEHRFAMRGLLVTARFGDSIAMEEKQRILQTIRERLTRRLAMEQAFRLASRNPPVLPESARDDNVSLDDDTTPDTILHRIGRRIDRGVLEVIETEF